MNLMKSLLGDCKLSQMDNQSQVKVSSQILYQKFDEKKQFHIFERNITSDRICTAHTTSTLTKINLYIHLVDRFCFNFICAKDLL